MAKMYRCSGGGNSKDTATLSSLIDRGITEISNDRVTSVGRFAFYDCRALKTVNLPNVTSIGSSAFYDCSSLTEIDIPNVTSVGSQAFYGCDKLITIILRNTETVCTLDNTNAFTRTPMAGSSTGYIYVPSALLSSYKTATNWSTYSAKFRAIEDYPDICG